MNFSFLIFCPAFFAGNCLCSYAFLSVPWAELTHISHPERTHPFFPCMKRCTLFNFSALTKRYDGCFVTENRKRTIFPLVKFLLYSDKWGEPFVAGIFTCSLVLRTGNLKCLQVFSTKCSPPLPPFPIVFLPSFPFLFIIFQFSRGEKFLNGVKIKGKGRGVAYFSNFSFSISLSPLTHKKSRG